MVLIAALIVGASAQLGAASEQETWIVVQSDGEERAAFVPAKEPYTEGGPAVSVYLRSKNVRTKDGLVITGFEFIVGKRQRQTGYSSLPWFLGTTQRIPTCPMGIQRIYADEISRRIQ
jgi:hypothetical protein